MARKNFLHFLLMCIFSFNCSTEAAEMDFRDEVIQRVLKKIPSIQETQKWAIAYADVSKNKIEQWKKLAKRKAWIPKVSIGADGDKNRKVSDSVWGSYSSGGQEYLGTDDKSFDSNFSWDVSLSWDLSDLVWSTDQTTIDVRSRSMVQLREDILKQVTSLYFERLRIQLSIESELAANKSIHSQTEKVFVLNAVVQKKIRIEEITALIDSYTDGQFSKHINP